MSETKLPLRSLLEQAIEDINDYDYDGAIRLIKMALLRATEQSNGSLTLDLDTIEARAKAATPGPWEAEADDGATMVYQRGEDTEICRLTKNHKANAAFIAHAREDIVTLVNALRSAEQANGEP